MAKNRKPGMASLGERLAGIANELREQANDEKSLQRAAALLNALSPNTSVDAAADAAIQIAVFGALLEQSGLKPAGLAPAAEEVWAAATGVLDNRRTAAAIERLQPLLASPEVAARQATAAESVAFWGSLFEQFLQAYDRTLRRRRGIYFTPLPVARYIVRSAGELLAEQFPPVPNINLIDPACGCGVFLSEALGLTREGQPPATITGFEILPATWFVAQVLLAPLATNRRPHIHLANPLDTAERWETAILGAADEAALPVIVGNPPYANFGRQNRSPWIRGLLDEYKTSLDERKLNLDDDFIKFLRWGQYWIDRAGGGILAMITSRTYLRGLTHRRMRASLLSSFDAVYLLDLHGSSGHGRRSTAGAGDENVFAIQTGVAIGLFVKRRHRVATHQTAARVQYAEMLGPRETKLATLQQTTVATTAWSPLTPQPPANLFAPVGAAPSSDYAAWWPLDRIFRHFISGVQTKRDALFVGFTREEVAEKVSRWLTEHCRVDIAAPFDPARIRPYLVAPFDRRWIYYDPRLLGRARESVMRHMLRPNVGLVFMRQSANAGPYDHFLAVDCLVSDRVFYSRHGAPFLAPLWLWEAGEKLEAGNRVANLSDDFVAAVSQRIAGPCTPLQAFRYLYAVVYSPQYREAHADELRVSFPRIPLPRDAEQFWHLVALGQRLVELHLAPGQELDCRPNVPQCPDLTNFTIGGYPVVHRWHKQRRGRTLTIADERYIARVVQVLAQTSHALSADSRILPPESKPG